MNQFSTGMLIGTMFGIGMLLAINPMDKRAMKKSKYRANKMLRSVSDAMRDLV